MDNKSEHQRPILRRLQQINKLNIVASLMGSCLLIVSAIYIFRNSTDIVVVTSDYIELKASPFEHLSMTVWFIGFSWFLFLVNRIVFVSRNSGAFYVAWGLLIFSLLPLTGLHHSSRVSRSEIVSTGGMFFNPSVRQVDLKNATKIKFNCPYSGQAGQFIGRGGTKRLREWVIESGMQSTYYAPGDTMRNNQHLIARFLAERGLAVSENCE